MRHLAALAAALVLTACGHTQAGKPGIEVRTVQVPVIRVEKCIAADAVPAKPAKLPKRPPTVTQALDVAVAKVLEWEIWGNKANALMQPCLATSPTPQP